MSWEDEVIHMSRNDSLELTLNHEGSSNRDLNSTCGGQAGGRKSLHWWNGAILLACPLDHRTLCVLLWMSAHRVHKSSSAYSREQGWKLGKRHPSANHVLRQSSIVSVSDVFAWLWLWCCTWVLIPKKYGSTVAFALVPPPGRLFQMRILFLLDKRAPSALAATKLETSIALAVVLLLLLPCFSASIVLPFAGTNWGSAKLFLKLHGLVACLSQRSLRLCHWIKNRTAVFDLCYPRRSWLKSAGRTASWCCSFYMHVLV